MHPEVVSESPITVRSGMKLLPVEAPTYTCPMHPEVTSDEPGHCPECGMAPPCAAGRSGRRRRGHQHGEHDHTHGGHEHSTADGIEWEDDMVEVNRLTTPANTRWAR